MGWIDVFGLGGHQAVEQSVWVAVHQVQSGADQMQAFVFGEDAVVVVFDLLRQVFRETFGGPYQSNRPVRRYDPSEHLTSYASSCASEDFAEVFAFFLRHKGRLPMRLRGRKVITGKWRFVEALANPPSQRACSEQPKLHGRDGAARIEGAPWRPVRSAQILHFFICGRPVLPENVNLQSTEGGLSAALPMASVLSAIAKLTRERRSHEKVEIEEPLCSS